MKEKNYLGGGGGVGGIVLTYVARIRKFLGRNKRLKDLTSRSLRGNSQSANRPYRWHLRRLQRGPAKSGKYTNSNRNREPKQQSNMRH